MSSKKPRDGISLRTIHIFLVIGAFLLSGLMLYSTFYLSASFRNLTESSEHTIELRKAALELMDASDYMTERVQRFAVTGNKQMLQDYYNEAYGIKHRENAIKKLSTDKSCENALKRLSSAMESSQRLMQREFYAMALVVDAKDIKDVPLPLDDVVLSDRDKALSPDEKMQRATDIVTDNDYYAQKHQIRENMEGSLDELEKLASETDSKALKDMKARLISVRIVIVLETISIFFLVWLASHLGINPIIRAVDRIKNNKKLPEAGTSEFRYLVRAYNQMYEMYRESIAKLDFKASHDELTGVFNRTGYEAILSSIELESTYMLLFDVDNFKTINDTYGHKTGDEILKKIVKVLQKNFRPDDFICRIGGDEFIVLMQRTTKEQKNLVADKIEKINKELEEATDGLPCASISVGIVHGTEASEMEELFKKTDVAMYQSKQRGKKAYTFYSTNQSPENEA